MSDTSGEIKNTGGVFKTLRKWTTPKIIQSLGQKYNEYMYPLIPTKFRNVDAVKNITTNKLDKYRDVAGIFNKTIKSQRQSRDIPQYGPMIQNKYYKYMHDNESNNNIITPLEPAHEEPAPDEFETAISDIRKNIQDDIAKTIQEHTQNLDKNIDIPPPAIDSGSAIILANMNEKEYNDAVSIIADSNIIASIRLNVNKTVNYGGLLLKSGINFITNSPLKYKTVKKAYDDGMFGALWTMSKYNYVKTDWTKKENLDSYYNSLFKIVIPILEIIFDEYLKKGCDEIIPQLLMRIIHPKTATILLNNKLSQELWKNTYDTCNSVVPQIANSIIKNGYNAELNASVKMEISNYIKNTMDFCIDIVYDIIKYNLLNKVNVNIKEAILYDEIISKDEIIEMFNDNFAEYIITNAKQVFNNYMHSVKPTDVSQTVNAITTNDTTIAEQEVKDKLYSILSVKNNKITIYDLTKPEIRQLFIKWIIEIEANIHEKNNPYFVANCILNVIDLRLHVIVGDICKLLQKTDELYCSNDVIKMLELISTKPVHSIDDIRSVIKPIIINAFDEYVNKTKNKVYSMFKKHTHIQKTFIYSYMMSSPTNATLATVGPSVRNRRREGKKTTFSLKPNTKPNTYKTKTKTKTKTIKTKGRNLKSRKIHIKNKTM